jgi:hypothetical protein
VTESGGPGYPDWQRVENWDGPVIWEGEGGALSGPQTSGVVPCSRYASLVVYVLPAELHAKRVAITVQWFRQAVGGPIVFARTIVTFTRAENPSIPLTFHIPNMGPFVKVTLAPITASETWEAEWMVRLDNRQYAVESPVQNPIMVAVAEHALAEAGTAVVLPSFYYSGPALLNVNIAHVGMAVDLQSFDPVGLAYALAGRVEPNAAGVWQAIPMQLPLGAWRLVFRNIAGVAATISGGLVVAPTGSN